MSAGQPIPLFARTVAPLLACALSTVSPAQTVEPADRPAVDPPPPARIEAEPPPQAPDPPRTPWQRWVAWKDWLYERHRTELSLNIDVVGRFAAAGPVTQNTDKVIARYDLLVRHHLSDDALFSMDIRGGWGEGLDPRIGLFANTDQYAQTDSEIFILHLYYQQQFADDQFTVRIGKFDIGDWVDTNRYGYYNFVGYSFAHNTTIPLTGNTLGVMTTWQPHGPDGLYLSAGISNATQTPFEAGFDTTFHDEPDWLTIAEIGLPVKIAGREGVYRFIAWHNSLDFGDDPDAVGFAISFDQDLTERLGAFFRFGVTNSNPLAARRYYSAGFHLKSPFDHRPNDTLALGLVFHEFADARSDSISDAANRETYIELYYNLHANDWMQLQPFVHIIDNPGGRDRNAVFIAGVHLALRF